MKQYNKFIVLNTILLLIVAVCTNIIIYNIINTTSNKKYVVEINRLMYETNENNIDNSNLPSLKNYKLIKQVDYINANASPFEMKIFFDGNNVKASEKYTIRPVYNEDNLVGYLRFSYVEKNHDLHKIQLIINISLAIIFTLYILALLYIRNKILKPFDEINDLPYKLSKGHLSDNLSESKNHFFGKFLWGLDLLRENLNQHKKRELQLEKEKKLMILSISHDIKTPLSAIKLYSKALYEKLYQDEEKQMLTAKSIESKVTQIEGFVNEIVKMSTTDIVDIEVNIDDFYLKDLVDKIRSSYCDKLKLLKTDFIIKPYSNKLLNGDIDKLFEVVENIIENAIKYGDGKNIEISFSQQEYCQLITITNSGCPLSTGESVHIFESFWRGSNSSNKKGSGLGLYICKQIMHKLDGEIFATNDDNSMRLTIVIKEG